MVKVLLDCLPELVGEKLTPNIDYANNQYLPRAQRIHLLWALTLLSSAYSKLTPKWSANV